MTWYFDMSDRTAIDVYDHTGANVVTVQNPDAPRVRQDAQGVPVEPDVPKAVLDHLLDRGQADIYALRAVAEALTGAGFEEGTPP